MKRITFTCKCILGALLALSVPLITRGTDNPIFPTGQVFVLRGLTWGTSTTPGFNNNFFFTPIFVSESVCVYVKNNNTTNPHTFTASISVTPDPLNSTPSDGTWQVGASVGLNAPTSPGQSAGIGVSISGTSQVSINFSASATQAGSPDTANVTIIQTTGTCFSGNQFTTSSPQIVSSVPAIQVISEGLSQSYEFSLSVTNPASGQVIAGATPDGNANKSMYFDKVIISVSAAAVFNIFLDVSRGICGSSTPTNLNMTSGSPSGVVPSAGVGFAGVCNPARWSNGPIQVQLGAGQSITIDLKGLIANRGTTNGIDVEMGAALTGTASASLFWYEK